jgi:hypothetical protein
MMYEASGHYVGPVRGRDRASRAFPPQRSGVPPRERFAPSPTGSVHEARSRPERSHPRADFLDERSRAHHTHAVTRAEVSGVVSDEEARSGADGCGEDGHVLHVGECARELTVVRCWTWNGTARRNSSKSGAALRELCGQIPSDPVHGSLGNHQSKEAELRTSASTQTGNGSVFSGWPTQILQGQPSRSAQTLHFNGEPRHDQHARTEQHRSIEVDQGQGVSFTEPILLAYSRRQCQRPPPSDMDRHRGRHTENRYIRISVSGRRTRRFAMSVHPKWGKVGSTSFPPSWIRRVCFLGFSSRRLKNR